MSWAMGTAVLILTKGSLLLLAAGLVGILWRRADAARRHLIWMSALLGLGCLPLAERWLPSIELAWLPPPPSRVAWTDGDPARHSAPRSAQTAVEAPMSVAVDRALEPAPRAIDLWLLLWALGSVGLLSRLMVGAAQLRRLEAEAEPFESVELRRLLAQISPRSNARFVIHPSAESPCTWGAARPVVLLPSSASSWSYEALRDVVVHELAHVERRDWLSNRLAQVVCALFFFQPLAWLAAARLAREAELACDDRVLAFGASAPDYAERLLAFARRARRRPALPALPMARAGELSLRIAAILDPKLRRKAMTRLNVCLVLSAAFALVVAIAPSHLVYAKNGAEVRASRAEAPLLDAAESGDLARIAQLIDRGEPVNVGVTGEGTPLIQAALAGHEDAVEALIQAGADVNLAETAGPRYHIPRTPLGAAAVSGDVAVAERLLAAGADVELAPRGDASPLMIAARTGVLPMVDFLIESGADADRAIRGDGSVLIRAAASGNPDVVARVLAADADPNRTVRGDGSPLIHAASRGDVESVKLLLAAGADPNLAVRGDGSPLIAARGNAEIVDLLVAAGAEVDGAVDGDGSPLIRAAGSGDRAMVERLLDAGADPDGAVRGDGSPLIRAAASGQTEIVELLLDRGASIDQVVPGDENALIQAAGAGRLATVELLLDRGADINRAVKVKTWGLGSEVRTPLSMARRGGHDQVADLLVQRGARD